MELQCEEPYCLQLVPEHLFQSHQDQHLAELLAAEEFEHQRQIQLGDAAVATAIAKDEGMYSIASDTEDQDYRLALTLNREFRQKEEQQHFRQVQVVALFSITLSYIRNERLVLKTKKRKNIELGMANLMSYRSQRHRKWYLGRI